MHPDIIMIVEDEPNRIKRLLQVICDSKHPACLHFKDESTQILNEMNKRGIRSIINGNNIKVIFPGFESNFDNISKVMNSSANSNAICFLDLQLKNDLLNELCFNSVGNILPDAVQEIAAGLWIGVELFKRKFGRLIVQVSSKVGPLGWEMSNTDDYFESKFSADSVKSAEKIIASSLEEYKNRYCLHPIAEIAKALFFFQRAYVQKWDNVFFTHGILQGKTSNHLNSIRDEFMGNADIYNDYFATGDSRKGLFMFTYLKRTSLHNSLTSEDLRLVKKCDLLKMFDYFGIKCEIDEAIDDIVLPVKPGISFLMSLKYFIDKCSDEELKRNPPVKIEITKKSNNFLLKMSFDQKCDGISEQRKTRKKKGTLHADRSASEALDALLRCQVLEINESLKVSWIDVFKYNDAKELYFLSEVNQADKTILLVGWPINGGMSLGS